MAATPTHGVGSDAPLTLHTLGRASLTARSADGEAAVFDAGKPLALVTYLALAPGREASREHLIDLLWADLEPEAARHALRQTLWYVRRRTGRDIFASDAGRVRLAATIESDRDALLAAADRGDFETVVALYRGDFLPGFAAPGGAEFEKWADVERLRLRSTFLRCAESLCRRWLSASRFRDAQQLARRVRDGDRSLESGWRLLIETLVAASDAVAAGVEADALERMLADEDRDPEQATRAALRTARQTMAHGAGADATAVRLHAELVGREREFSAILAAWDAVRAGASRHVHVVAPAGLGKSRLLDDVRARLRASRARVVLVRASPGAREIAYALAADLAAALAALPGARGISPDTARALVSLNPALSATFAAPPDAASGDELHRHRVLALRELLAAVAEDYPVALLVDDVHWGDAASRNLLEGVLGALGAQRVLAITAARPVPEGSLATGATAFVRLPPLTPSDVTALVASLGTLPVEPWVDAFVGELRRVAAGSPLLALETLQMLDESELLWRDAGTWRVGDASAMLDSLRAGGALRQRLAAPSEAERRVLLHLAVAGEPVGADVVAGALRLPEADAAALLRALEQRGLVNGAAGGWLLSHDEFGALLLDDAGEEARAAHAAIGAALATDASADARRFKRAAAHLVAGDDRVALARLFARFAAAARSAGDRRPNRALARDLVGDHAPADVVSSLVRALPLRARLGLHSPARVAAAAALMLIGASTVVLAMLRDPSPPDATIAAVYADDDGIYRLCVAPLHAPEWEPGVEPLSLRCAERVPLGGSAGESVPPELSVSHRGEVVVSRSLGDSGAVDLFRVERSGSARRMTAELGDDWGPRWSPDGRAIAFTTGRWNAEGFYDVAVMDAASGEVRGVRAAATTERTPVWSPDGAELAFVRVHRDSGAAEVCSAQRDGSDVRCVVPEAAVTGLHAWTGASEVLAEVSVASSLMLARVDLETGKAFVLDATSGRRAISPDGRFVACRCGPSRIDLAPWTVAPLTKLAAARTIRIEGVDPSDVARVEWVPSGRDDARRGALVSIAVEPTPGPPRVGEPYRLSAIGRTQDDRDIRLRRVHWRSLDTLVATVDSSGVLVARRPGTARIEVTATGARTLAHEVATMAPTPTREVVRETWREGITSRWTPFGVPRPDTATGPDGVVAFANRGEGSYSSGVYSSGTIDARRGLRVETRLSTVVTSTHWQATSVSITGDLDDQRLSRWDHRLGALPFRRDFGGGCSIAYPGGEEGQRYADFVGITVGRQVVRLPARPAMRTGEWFPVAIELLPDGRCRFEIDGREAWTSPPATITDSAVRVMLLGNSFETKSLVGPLLVLEGAARP